MKTQVSQESFLAGLKLAGRSFMVLAIFLGGVWDGLAQAGKKETPRVTSAPLPGYLSKAAPSGLRFAAPPKPPVAYLPPLPIPTDPQPVFSPEFAQPIADVSPPARTNPTPSPKLPNSVQWPEIATMFTNKQGQIPPTPVDMGAVSPQMLVRFFQSGKPADVQMLMADPVSFRVPVKEEKPSSSASYQVK